jgi:hypothetical protein
MFKKVKKKKKKKKTKVSTRFALFCTLRSNIDSTFSGLAKKKYRINDEIVITGYTKKKPSSILFYHVLKRNEL